VRRFLWSLPWLLVLGAIVWGTQLPPCPDFLDGPCSPDYDPLPPLFLLVLGVVGILVELAIGLTRLPRKGARVEPDDRWQQW
jgi:hypothetical protein